MRGCLPEIASDSVHWTPSLIAQVTAILARKFSDELRVDGCTRHGPDSCLVIFQALYGLDPDLLEQYAGRIKAITVEEIKSVARRYFTLDRRAMGVVRGQGDPSLTR